MFKATKSKIDDLEIYQLSGSINEDVRFSELIESPEAGGSLGFDCRDVSRINSMGIKMWCVYFRELRQKGVNLRFHNCSPAIVEQCSYVAHFINIGELHSICLRFFCSKCILESLVVESTLSLIESKFKLPTITCELCSSAMAFDESPEEYFSFIQQES